jgi:hypothetical protein
MKKKSVIIMLTTILLSSVLLFSSFSKNDVNAQSNHGISNAIPAFYDGKSFTIIFVEFTSQAEKSLLAHNSSINIIYRCDAFPGFISVLDAVPGPGMNAIWQEVQIQFNTLTPQQLFSDNDILAYAASGAITLVPTTEVYTCPVIGQKPK